MDSIVQDNITNMKCMPCKRCSANPTRGGKDKTRSGPAFMSEHLGTKIP